MKFTPSIRKFSIASLCLFAFSFSHADTVLLKDGTELEGKIEEETPEHIKIIVQVTKSIREPKIIPRANIKEVIKLTPAEIAFKKLKSVPKTGDMLTAADYDTIINTEIKPYLTQFPGSPNQADVEKMLADVEAEKAKVAEGSIRLNGEWISAEQIAADPYNHSANILAADFEKKIAAQEFTEALADFEKLQQQYDESKAFARSIPTVKSALDSLDAQLAQMKGESAFKVKKRETELASMPGDQRVNSENAFKREMETYQQLRATAKEAGEAWLPVSIWDPASIDEAIKTAETKRAGYTGLDAAEETQRAALLEQVILAVNEGNWAVALAQVQLADDAGGDSTMLKELTKQANDGNKEAAAIAKAKKDAEEKERLEKVRMEREKEIADRKAAEEGTTPDAATKDTATSDPKETGDAEVEKPKPAKEKSSSVDEEEGTEVAKKEDKGGLPVPLIIAIVGIMAAVSIFMIKKNKAKAAEDDLESISGDHDGH